MQKYFSPMICVLALCALTHAQDKSIEKVSIKGETWKEKAGYDPEIDPPSAGWYTVRVKNGPGFWPNAVKGRIEVLHGDRLDDAEALKLPVRAVTSAALSSDHKTLYVGSATDWSVWAFRLGRDGMPIDGRRAFDLAMPPRTERLRVAALATDSSGRLYAATSLGIQVFDSKGKIVEILSLPGNGKPLGLIWFGKNRDVLLVSGEWSLNSFALKLNAVGTAYYFGDSADN